MKPTKANCEISGDDDDDGDEIPDEEEDDDEDGIANEGDKMKTGELVHPFFEEENNTIGLVLGRTHSATGREFMQILIHGKIYSVPMHQIRELK